MGKGMIRYVNVYTVYYRLKTEEGLTAEKYYTRKEADARVREMQIPGYRENYYSDPMVGSSIEAINLD
jgi:hypothetical protein